MAASAQRKITLTYTGAVTGIEEISAATNLASPAQIQILTLAIGDNMIAVPGGGSTPVSCTIVKPSANASTIKLKGITGDTGVSLHLTDPDTISLAAGVTSFVLNAAAQIVGVRLMWT